MLTQWDHLSLYGMTGLTLLAVLFPLLDIIGGLDEYGFIPSGPPSFSAALGQANTTFGTDAHRFTGAVPFSIDVIRLFIELAVIWGVYIGLRRIVLKQTAA